jgi:uncharacterized membrane protein YfcA
VLIQAMIFITVIDVEPITLISMLVSAAAGAVWGAGIVSKLQVNRVRLIMGLALIITAGFMLAVNMEWLKGGGTAIGLKGFKLVFAVAVNFFLGALMTAGIGLYAPCMAMVFSLGLSPQVAFPIMMGSCAFLMPPASVRFIKEGAYNRKAAMAMAVPGIIAVFIAAFIVKSLPLASLRWLVILVVLYTASVLIRSIKKDKIASA